MSAALNVQTVALFLLVVFPGLVSTTIYRLIMPARVLDWGNALLQGLFYSAVNFVLGLPILYWLVVGYDPLGHPVRYSSAAILVLLVTPVVWPLALVSMFKSNRLAGRIQVPYPTAWDFLFNQCEPGFVLVHLSNEKLLGGYWGADSYAGTYPNEGDIYLEAVYAVDAAGKFGDPIPNTRGILLRKEQYAYIELFSVTKIEGAANGKKQEKD